MSKTYERLQKKLKERQGGGGGGGGGGGPLKDSPPSSPQKSRGSTPTAADIHNGVGGKGLEFDAGLASAGAGANGLGGRGMSNQSEGT